MSNFFQMSRDDGKIWLKMEISWEYTTHTLTNTCDARVVGEDHEIPWEIYVVRSRNTDNFTTLHVFYVENFSVPPISSGGIHGRELKWFHSHHVFFQQIFFAGAFYVGLLDGLLDGLLG